MKNKKCILVSACLLGENCKYNGGNNYNQAVIDFVADKDVLAVCAEVGIDRTLSSLAEKNIDFAILQSRSPSCGVNQIYDGHFSGRKIEGSGLFAQALKKRGYRVIDAEDIIK